jgi:hypothetical protein
MKFGPTIYKQCNHCQETVTIHPVMEINPRQAVLWTDGYINSPMAPEQTLVARCGHCQELIWLPTLPQAAKDKEASARDYEQYKPKEILSLLEHPLAQGLEHQLYLRFKIWHLANHKYRNEKKAVVEYSPEEENNMEALLDLLEPAEQRDRLIMGELLRQLGRFDEAQQILEFVFSDDLYPFAEQLRQLSAGGQRQVQACTKPGSA